MKFIVEKEVIPLGNSIGNRATEGDTRHSVKKRQTRFVGMDTQQGWTLYNKISIPSTHNRVKNGTVRIYP